MTDKQVKNIIKMTEKIIYEPYYYCNNEYPRIEITYRDWLPDGVRYVAEYLKTVSDYRVIAQGSIKEVSDYAHKFIRLNPTQSNIIWYSPLSHQQHLSFEKIFPGIEITVNLTKKKNKDK